MNISHKHIPVTYVHATILGAICGALLLLLGWCGWTIGGYFARTLMM